MPSAAPLTPLSTSVSGPSLVAVACCGVRKPAEKAIWPGLSAVSRTTITWSTGLANTSRVNFTPPVE